MALKILKFVVKSQQQYCLLSFEIIEHRSNEAQICTNHVVIHKKKGISHQNAGNQLFAHTLCYPITLTVFTFLLQLH